ncbi:MAG: MOSC domain-containing protein [Betaproteobacteria bacterium]|jgi:hypothetical protein|nr:MOSC domain-containing protein [Betaproteobacteria bacterium]NBT66548.1 MOSC domain-containing protein [Betaproteobacteria bacterium]
MSDIQAHISQLWIYPIKSCGGISVEESILTPTGLEWDRNWMVVDKRGEFISQRDLPNMALIQPTMRRSDMVLRAPGMLALHVALYEVETPTHAQVWDDRVKAFDMGDVAGQWFKSFLTQDEKGKAFVEREGPLRLVRFDPDHRRASSIQWTKKVAAQTQFADGFPLLLCSQASLDELNQRLTKAGHAAVEMNRFRPNVVITGVEAHDEDRLAMLNIQTNLRVVDFQPVKPCGRCSITNIDPLTAESSPEVSDMLQTYRQDPRLDGSVTFGMNTIEVPPSEVHEEEPVLRVGQAVQGQWAF